MKNILLLLLMSSTIINSMESPEEVVVVDNQKISDDEEWVWGCQLPFDSRFLLDVVFKVQNEEKLKELQKRSDWFKNKMQSYPNLVQTIKSLDIAFKTLPVVLTNSQDPEDANVRLNFNEMVSVKRIKELIKNVPYTQPVNEFTYFNSNTITQKILKKGLNAENEEDQEKIKQILTPDELAYHTKRMIVHYKKFAAPVGDRKELFLLLGLLGLEEYLKEYYIGTPQIHFHPYKYVTFADDLKYLINDEEGTVVNSPLCKKITRAMVQL